MAITSATPARHNPNLVTIAPARERDGEWCAQLMAGSEPWITLGRGIEQCRAVLQRRGDELYVARDGGQPVGFILIRPIGCAGSPYIVSVAVAESARGQGIGAKLIAFAEKHMAGSRFIFLCVSSFNLRAQAFYLRLGYEKVGALPDYIIEGHSELLLCKRLA